MQLLEILHTEMVYKEKTVFLLSSQIKWAICHFQCHSFIFAFWVEMPCDWSCVPSYFWIDWFCSVLVRIWEVETTKNHARHCEGYHCCMDKNIIVLYVLTGLSPSESLCWLHLEHSPIYFSGKSLSVCCLQVNIFTSHFKSIFNVRYG